MGGKIGDEGDAIGRHARDDDAALGQRVEPLCRLERDGAGEDAAVHFGQHDIHGQVAGAKATGGILPFALFDAGECQLENGAVGPFQYAG
ncbi:hypothetical protein LTR94_036446, partial [Friedmanniomyces endolithicus]